MVEFFEHEQQLCARVADDVGAVRPVPTIDVPQRSMGPTERIKALAFYLWTAVNRFFLMSIIRQVDMGDGNRVEIEICHRRLLETLGPWPRVRPSAASLLDER